MSVAFCSDKRKEIRGTSMLAMTHKEKHFWSKDQIGVRHSNIFQRPPPLGFWEKFDRVNVCKHPLVSFAKCAALKLSVDNCNVIYEKTSNSMYRKKFQR